MKTLELNFKLIIMAICPLLFDYTTYNPDTVDLNSDLEAKNFWFNCFRDKLIYKISEQALKANSKESVEKFKQEYLMKLEELQNQNK